MRRVVIFLCFLQAVCASAGPGDALVFGGACDASAVVALNDDLFVAASDEDNLLRFYRLSHPGEPIQMLNLNPLLAGKKKSPEMDIEAAAKTGQSIFWITSHGRKANGEFSPNRHRLFALELNEAGGKFTAQTTGNVYTNLIADLSRDSRFTTFRLARAAELKPESPGGLNIEALTETPGGALLIGFRSPVPDGLALIVPLLNPFDVLAGQPPRFGDALRLDLDGLGLRGMESTGAGYYLLAGPAEGKGRCRLLFWDGTETKPRPVPNSNFSNVNLEGIFFSGANHKTNLLVFGDDSSRNFNGTDCKDLPESQRQFRAFSVGR